MSDRDRNSERSWVGENRSSYFGQWVALAGRRLVAFGKDAKVVYRDARDLGVENPYLVYIEEERLPFAGW